MPPIRLSRALLRRWYIVLAGLLLTALGCIATTALVPAQYEAQAVVLLLPPNGPTGDNPYLNLGSLTGLNVVLDQALGSADSIAMVHSKGIAGTYAIADANGSAGPLVEVSGQADTPSQARRITSFVTQLVPQTLRNLQNAAGVTSDKAYITSMVLNPVGKATAVTKRQTRALIAVGAAGILLTIVLVALAERIALTRSIKADTSTPNDDPAPAGLAMANGQDLKSESRTPSTDEVRTTAAVAEPVDTDQTAPTEPAVTEPAVTEPAVTEPAVTEPAVTEPAVTEPAVTEPAVTEPAVTEPAVTEPAVTEPAVTEPAVTEPAVTEPAVTEPAVTEPAVLVAAAVVARSDPSESALPDSARPDNAASLPPKAKRVVPRKPMAANADASRDAASTTPPSTGTSSGATTRSVRVRRVRPATKGVLSTDAQPAPRPARG